MNTDRINAINALIALDDDNDLLSHITRELLICDDASTIDESIADEPRLAPIAHAIQSIIIDLDRDELTAMRLDYSLCPLHACDYAICFDDDDAECAPIRTIHPTHDT